jgi:hypothetical protein
MYFLFHYKIELCDMRKDPSTVVKRDANHCLLESLLSYLVSVSTIHPSSKSDMLVHHEAYVFTFLVYIWKPVFATARLNDSVPSQCLSHAWIFGHDPPFVPSSYLSVSKTLT